MDKREIFGWMMSFIIPFIIIHFLLNYIFGVAIVQGPSMEPLYYAGDFVIILRTDTQYERGEIVVIEHDKHLMIKRVVGICDETIDLINGEVFINSCELKEDYVVQPTFPLFSETISYPHRIREDSYFVLGDNRVNSKDSRAVSVGDIHKSNIVGKVIFHIESKK